MKGVASMMKLEWELKKPRKLSLSLSQAQRCERWDRVGGDVAKEIPIARGCGKEGRRRHGVEEL